MKRSLTDEEKQRLKQEMADVTPLPKTRRKRREITLEKNPAYKSRKRAPLDELSSTLDLHGMTLERAHQLLVSFVALHMRAGTNQLLIITGKSGALKREVPRWLTLSDMHSRIRMVSQAKPQHGGEGAVYVHLKHTVTS